MQELIEQLQGDVRRKQVLIESQRGDVKSKQVLIEQLEGEVKSLHGKIQQLEDDLQAKHSSSQSYKDQTDKELTENDVKISTLESSLEDEKAMAASLTKQLENLQMEQDESQDSYSLPLKITTLDLKTFSSGDEKFANDQIEQIKQAIFDEVGKTQPWYKARKEIVEKAERISGLALNIMTYSSNHEWNRSRSDGKYTLLIRYKSLYFVFTPVVM